MFDSWMSRTPMVDAQGWGVKNTRRIAGKGLRKQSVRVRKELYACGSKRTESISLWLRLLLTVIRMLLNAMLFKRECEL